MIENKSEKNSSKNLADKEDAERRITNLEEENMNLKNQLSFYKNTFIENLMKEREEMNNKLNKTIEEMDLIKNKSNAEIEGLKLKCSELFQINSNVLKKEAKIQIKFDLYSEKIKALNQEIATLNNEIFQLNMKINELNNKIYDSDIQLEKKSSEINSLNNYIANMKLERKNSQ